MSKIGEYEQELKDNLLSCQRSTNDKKLQKEISIKIKKLEEGTLTENEYVSLMKND